MSYLLFVLTLNLHPSFYMFFDFHEFGYLLLEVDFVLLDAFCLLT
jgi:hypothetical protein